MIEILNHIQEKNLQYIQNQHDSEEDLELKKRELKQLKDELIKKQRDNNDGLKALEKKREVTKIIILFLVIPIIVLDTLIDG